jgi:hypothetical protein
MGDGEKINAIASARHIADNRIIDWRFEVLRKAGCGFDHALVIAARGDIDLHQAVEMLGQGCPSELLVEILT